MLISGCCRKEQASGGRTREGLGDNNKRLDVCRTRASEADTDEPGRGGKKGEKGGGGGGGGSGCLGRSTGASTSTCYTSRSPASAGLEAPRGSDGGDVWTDPFPGRTRPEMRSSQKTRRRRAARGRGPSPPAFFRNRHKPARLAHINLNAKAIPCSLQTTANKNSPFPAALDMNEFNEETPSAPPAFAAINPCEMSHARCFFMHPNRTPSTDVFRPAPGFLCRASSDRGALTRPQCSAPLTKTTCTRRVLHRIDTSRGDAEWLMLMINSPRLPVLHTHATLAPTELAPARRHGTPPTIPPHHHMLAIAHRRVHLTQCSPHPLLDLLRQSLLQGSPRAMSRAQRQGTIACEPACPRPPSGGSRSRRLGSPWEIGRRRGSGGKSETKASVLRQYTAPSVHRRNRYLA
jgi:hypothetical protein